LKQVKEKTDKRVLYSAETVRAAWRGGMGMGENLRVKKKYNRAPLKNSLGCEMYLASLLNDKRVVVVGGKIEGK